MNLITLISLSTALLKAALEAAPAIEKALPESGQGSAKLALLMDILRAVVESAKDGISWDDAAPLAARIINAVVSFFNATGRFNKS